VLVHNARSGDSWGSQNRLQQKFDKHGEKLGFESVWEYEEASIGLTCTCDGVAPGVQRKVDSITGKSYFFNKESGEFAITLKDNGILDYYYLDGGQKSFNGMPGLPG